MRIFLTMLIISTAVFSQSYSNLDNLSWLSGTWKFEMGKSAAIEEWQEITASTFEGAGYSVKGETGDTTLVESLRLVNMHGDIFYMPYVKHNPAPVAFKLVYATQDSFVFENQQHDFPKKIIYIKKDNTRFEAYVEGHEKGKFKSFTLYFNRVD